MHRLNQVCLKHLAAPDTLLLTKCFLAKRWQHKTPYMYTIWDPPLRTENNKVLDLFNYSCKKFSTLSWKFSAPTHCYCVFGWIILSSFSHYILQRSSTLALCLKAVYYTWYNMLKHPNWILIESKLNVAATQGRKPGYSIAYLDIQSSCAYCVY